MSLNKLAARATLWLLLAALSTLPLLAGSAAVGFVAGSLNATLGGKTLERNTSLFSGDSLQVKDGAAVIALKEGSRMVFGRESQATFLREADTVTVMLAAGNVSVFRPEKGTAVRVKVGDVMIEPAAGYATLGDVAMLNGAVVVTAKDGMLRVAEGKHSAEVKKGQSLTITPRTARSPKAGGGAGGAATSEGWATASNILEAAGAGLAGLGLWQAIEAESEADNSTKAASQACLALSPSNPNCPKP